MTSPPDVRAAQLKEALSSLASELGLEPPHEEEGADALDIALACVHSITDKARGQERAGEYGRKRLAELSEMISGLVRFDYTKRAPITEADDAFDGFAVYLNILSEELSASTVSKRFFTDIIESMTDALIVTGRDGCIRTLNREAAALSGHSREGLIGKPLCTTFPAISADELLAQGGVASFETICVRKGGVEVPVHVSVSIMRNSSNEPQGLVCVARDMTATKQLEEEKHRLTEAIQRQAIMVEELSAPLLPITNELLVLPLIGSVDVERARQIIEVLLNGIATRHARVAIIDITGMRTMDANAVEGIVGAVRAARLIGVRAVLTGVRPAMAKTLIELGIDLGGITTFATLQQGVSHALGNRALAGR